MVSDGQRVQALVGKIKELSPEKVSEVEDFVEFLRYREQDRRLIAAASRFSEDAFQQVWDNPDDADYDDL